MKRARVCKSALLGFNLENHFALNNMRTITITTFIMAVYISCNSSSTKPVIVDKKPQLIKTKDSLGLGTLDISFNLPVPLYRTVDTNIAFDTLKYNKLQNGKWQYTTTTANLLNPYEMSAGDSDSMAVGHIKSGLIRFPAVLAFRVLKADGNNYCIVINEKTLQTVVIKKRKDYTILSQRELFGSDIPKNSEGFYIYETWEHLLLRAQFVNLNTPYVLYDKPNGNIIYRNDVKTFLPLKVIEVKGDWIKMKKDNTREGNAKDMNKTQVWAKWKKGNKMLVDITEFTVE